jgi:parvulin-like peptidyl-prolyl isomerase
VIPLRKLAVLLALALLAGCGGGREVARVGDTAVHLSDVEVLYESGAVSAADFRQALFRVMAVEVLYQGLEADFQVVLQPAQVDEHLTELEAVLAESGSTAAEYLGVDDASHEMLRFNAEVLALRDAALDELVVSSEVVDGLFADPATMTTVCSKHILVATEEEAQAVLDRLTAGEDFAVVAGEVSLDTSSEGGDLGCVQAGAFVPAFAQAAMEAVIGEITGPVASDFGFHIIVVSERTTPTRDEYLADPRALLTEDNLSSIWSDWFNSRLQGADAWVAERYGTWTPTGILAPVADTTTTAPSRG